MNIHNVYQFFLKKFRVKRMSKFESEFSINDTTQIIDVGGGQFNWQFINSKPHITIVNIDKPSDWNNGITNTIFELGDGTNLQYKDAQFDVAYSNSVIEHLYTTKNQQLFADEIKRVAEKYYVQTPAKEFFIEPHLITPFIHWFPLSWQRRLMRNFTVWGLLTRPTQTQIDTFLSERVLLSYNEFKSLFPEATIQKENFLWFFTKSYIAVKK